MLRPLPPHQHPHDRIHRSLLRRHRKLLPTPRHNNRSNAYASTRGRDFTLRSPTNSPRRMRNINNRPRHPSSQPPQIHIRRLHRPSALRHCTPLPNRNRPIHPTHRRTHPRCTRSMQQHQHPLSHPVPLNAASPQPIPLPQHIRNPRSTPTNRLIYSKLHLHHTRSRPPHRQHLPGKDHRSPVRKIMQNIHHRLRRRRRLSTCHTSRQHTRQRHNPQPKRHPHQPAHLSSALSLLSSGSDTAKSTDPFPYTNHPAPKRRPPISLDKNQKTHPGSTSAASQSVRGFPPGHAS
jgi:hypothetical protein